MENTSHELGILRIKVGSYTWGYNERKKEANLPLHFVNEFSFLEVYFVRVGRYGATYRYYWLFGWIISGIKEKVTSICG